MLILTTWKVTSTHLLKQVKYKSCEIFSALSSSVAVSVHWQPPHTHTHTLHPILDFWIVTIWISPFSSKLYLLTCMMSSLLWFPLAAFTWTPPSLRYLLYSVTLKSPKDDTWQCLWTPLPSAPVCNGWDNSQKLSIFRYSGDVHDNLIVGPHSLTLSIAIAF